MKLTDKAVAALPTPAKGNRLHYDDQFKGFAARVTAAGGRAFVLSYRFGGRERRATIGGYPEWSTAAARAQALRWKRDVDLGVDPLAEREAEHPAGDGLFKARAANFLEHGRRKRGLPLRPATKREYKRALMVYAAALHGRPLAEIRRGEVATVIQRVAKERGEVTAMRTRAALSRLFSWAIANGHAELNPVAGTEGYATPKRSRVLSDAELRAIWTATAEPGDFNLIVRLCGWTGCRRAESGAMRDSERGHVKAHQFDDEVWTVPGSRTKNHRPLGLPLPRQARAALDAWPRAAGRDLLFGRGPAGFQGWSQSKARLDARVTRANAERRLGRPLAAGEEPAKEDALPAWDLHDLRRTVETRMAGLGVPKDHVNRILNHAAGPITEAYDLHTYLPEKAAALQLWADALERIVGEAPPNVLPMRRSGS
jgi:integrase